MEDTDLETLEKLEKSRTDLETLEKTGKKRKHKKVINLCGYWSGRPDSNQRPRRPERRALNQAELRPAEYKLASERSQFIHSTSFLRFQSK